MKGFGRWLRSNSTIDEGFKPCFSKAAYCTEKLVKEVIDRRKAREKNALRYYKCDICSLFHITSKPGEQVIYTETRKPNQTELEKYVQRHSQLLLDMEKAYDAGLFIKHRELKLKKKELLKEVKEKGLRIP